MINYWKSYANIWEIKRGGGRDTIKVTNLHLLYHNSYFFYYIFKMKLSLKSKDLFNY
jgi:hypothetical protein